MKRLVCVAIGMAVLATACSIDDGSTTNATLAPLGSPSNTLPPTTVTASVAGTQPLPIAATTTVVLPGGSCVFSPPASAGDVTFEVGTRMYELNQDAGNSITCLAELAAEHVGPFRWSPAGDRVLLNSATVFDGSQALPTGYLTTNLGVTWSYPTGKALIAPAVADSHLLWRTAGQAATRTDISFLARTDIAVYHPAGKNIFAAGLGNDGTAGLFVASNRGQNPRLIAQLDDPNTAITEIVPDTSGTRVYFVHDHRNGTFHVHALDLPALALTDITQATEPIAKLVAGTTQGSPVAWRIGDCAGLTRTQVAVATGQVADQPGVFATLSTEPLGWIDGQRLVVSTRATGCVGPSDLWLWNITTSTATPLVNGVGAASIRSVLSVFGELPGDAGNAAPG
jgi:hypothetical protein